MQLKVDPASGSAYLALDRGAHPHRRLPLGARRAWGITLDFDQEGRLIGLEVEDAHRRLSDALLDGALPVVELDRAEKYGQPGVGLAYIWLSPDRTRVAGETVVVDPDVSGAMGDVNLDIEADGHLIGIEFVDARDLPAVLLGAAHEI